MNEPLEQLERRLNVQAQQHLLNELRRLHNKQHNYDQMIVVLAISIVACIMAIGMDEHKLGKLEAHVRSIAKPRQVIFRLPVDGVEESTTT